MLTDSPFNSCFDGKVYNYLECKKRVAVAVQISNGWWQV
jgi:hypothetical protein